jgi:hypothetical protein
MPSLRPEPDSHQRLLVPFASASAPECHAVLTGLALPNLSALLAELTPLSPDAGDDHTLAPPHERALACLLGLPAEDGRTPWAAAASEQPTQPQAWLAPCHFQVGMDQVTLLPADQIGLEEIDSRALFDALVPFCAEDGIALVFESATRWHASGEPLRDLVCASLDRVSGRSVADWTPAQGRSALITRLQSEAQMLFYTHTVNDRREAERQSIVNGFWVHGAGALAELPEPVQPPTQPEGLRQAALRGDWSAWRQAWLALDGEDIAQALERVRGGGGGQVTLTLCGERHAQTWVQQPASLSRRLGHFFQTLRGPKPAWQALQSL